MTRGIVFVVLLAIASVCDRGDLVGAAQSRPDFSGRWTAEPGTSPLSSGGPAGRPDQGRLAVGDLHDQQTHDPQLMVFAGPLVGLLGVFFVVCGVLQFCGIDLEKMLGIKSKKKPA